MTDGHVLVGAATAPHIVVALHGGRRRGILSARDEMAYPRVAGKGPERWTESSIPGGSVSSAWLDRAPGGAS
jgi:hypothetical protein